VETRDHHDKRFADIKSQAPVSAEAKTCPLENLVEDTGVPLPQLRQLNDLTHAELARRLAVTQPSVSEIERSEAQQSRQSVVRLKRSVHTSESPQYPTRDADTSGRLTKHSRPAAIWIVTASRCARVRSQPGDAAISSTSRSVRGTDWPEDRKRTRLLDGRYATHTFDSPSVAIAKRLPADSIG
jgi:transcriptional regulator with XRE-family HTH domain